MTLSLFLMAVLLSAVAGFALVAYLMRSIKAQPVDNPAVAKIGKAIKLGAMTFLKEEYRVIAIVVLPVLLLLAYVSPTAAGCFFIGALFSSLRIYWHECCD